MNRYRHRNFGNAEKDGQERDLALSEAVKVNKLKHSQLKMYFNSLRVEKKQNSEKFGGRKHQDDTDESFDEKLLKKFLKRYGVRKRDAERPVMKRAPLKTVKTVQVELPLECCVSTTGGGATGGCGVALEPRRKLSSSYIEITKAIRAHNQKDVNKAMANVNLGTNVELSNDEDCYRGSEEFQFDNKAITNELIERQLQATQNEISLASTQLEQIKALLAERRNQLSPVLEEEYQEDQKEFQLDKLQKNKIKPNKDLDAKPKAEWKLKRPPSFSRNSRKKLMVTLDCLNQRLQKIQEKYFTEPKMKFKTIDEILAEPKRKNVKTIYENQGFESKKSDKLNSEAVKFKSDRINMDFNQTKFRNKAEKVRKEANPVEVILSPKFEIFDDSEFDLMTAKNYARNVGTTRRGILRNKPLPCETGVDVAVGEPSLEDSIIKSNFLMKEFNVGPDRGFNFDDLKMSGDRELTCGDFLKKNVRFSGNQTQITGDKNWATRGGKELQYAIDFALKNSLFYSEM